MLDLAAVALGCTLLDVRAALLVHGPSWHCCRNVRSWSLVSFVTGKNPMVHEILVSVCALCCLFSILTRSSFCFETKVALSSELCTAARQCTYGIDSAIASLASLLWFVAGLLAYLIHPPPLLPVDGHGREKSAASTTPANPVHISDVDMSHQGGIPTMIATTSTSNTATATYTANSNTRTWRGPVGNNHSLSISQQESGRDFDDVSELEIPVIGPSVRYAVYRRQHYVGGDDDSHRYPSPPPASVSATTQVSTRNLMYYQHDASSVEANADDDDDDDRDMNNDSLRRMMCSNGLEDARMKRGNDEYLSMPSSLSVRHYANSNNDINEHDEEEKAEEVGL
jgi:hypothetical protein